VVRLSGLLFEGTVFAAVALTGLLLWLDEGTLVGVALTAAGVLGVLALALEVAETYRLVGKTTARLVSFAGAVSLTAAGLVALLAGEGVRDLVGGGVCVLIGLLMMVEQFSRALEDLRARRGGPEAAEDEQGADSAPVGGVPPDHERGGQHDSGR
jgi:hypothetical protein